MKVEIVCPQGVGKGTKVYLDEQDMTDGITHLVLEIPADGIAALTVTRHAMESGKPIVTTDTNGDIAFAKEQLRFTGEFAAVAVKEVR